MQAEGEQSYGEGVEVSPLKGPVEKGDENSESGPDWLRREIKQLR